MLGDKGETAQQCIPHIPTTAGHSAPLGAERQLPINGLLPDCVKGVVRADEQASSGNGW